MSDFVVNFSKFVNWLLLIDKLCIISVLENIPDVSIVANV